MPRAVPPYSKTCNSATSSLIWKWVFAIVKSIEFTFRKYKTWIWPSGTLRLISWWKSHLWRLIMYWRWLQRSPVTMANIDCLSIWSSYLCNLMNDCCYIPNPFHCGWISLTFVQGWMGTGKFTFVGLFSGTVLNGSRWNSLLLRHVVWWNLQ